MVPFPRLVALEGSALFNCPGSDHAIVISLCRNNGVVPSKDIRGHHAAQLLVLF